MFPVIISFNFSRKANHTRDGKEIPKPSLIKDPLCILYCDDKEPRYLVYVDKFCPLYDQKNDAPPQLESCGLFGARFLDARERPRLESRGFQRSRHEKKNKCEIHDNPKRPEVCRDYPLFPDKYKNSVLIKKSCTKFSSQKVMVDSHQQFPNLRVEIG